MHPYDLTRLKACMRHAARGGELTIAFFGGSITQGCAAETHGNCCAYRVFRWWEETFPQARFHYVNGGIGGTTSHFGAARLVPDLLMYQPDFVVVDFSVNDTADAFFQETYEGVLRRILGWPSAPAVVLLHNVYYDSGENAEEAHREIGRHYHLPSVSVRGTVYRRMLAGAFTRAQLTADGLHPNDFGHGLIAAEITAFLEQVWARMDEPEGARPFPAPLTANAYEHARRLTIREASPQLLGFRADAREKTGHLDFFKNGWIGGKPGDAIRFEIEASCIAAQYRRTIQKPALAARLVLDGDTENAVLLDGNFDEDWDNCLALKPVLHHGRREKHTVEITVEPSGAGTAVLSAVAHPRIKENTFYVCKGFCLGRGVQRLPGRGCVQRGRQGAKYLGRCRAGAGARA